MPVRGLAAPSTACADGEIAQVAFKKPPELEDWLHPVAVRTLYEAADERRTLVQLGGETRRL